MCTTWPAGAHRSGSRSLAVTSSTQKLDKRLAGGAGQSTVTTTMPACWWWSTTESSPPTLSILPASPTRAHSNRSHELPRNDDRFSISTSSRQPGTPQCSPPTNLIATGA